VDAVKVNPQDGEAVKMVTRMDALFLVDRDARQKAMSGAELPAAANDPIPGAVRLSGAGATALWSRVPERCESHGNRAGTFSSARSLATSLLGTGGWDGSPGVSGSCDCLQ
jgi:hypothetical protein